jgi:hypothetical protein
MAVGAAVRSLRAEAVVQERASAAKASASRGLRKGFGMRDSDGRAAQSVRTAQPWPVREASDPSWKARGGLPRMGEFSVRDPPRAEKECGSLGFHRLPISTPWRGSHGRETMGSDDARGTATFRPRQGGSPARPDVRSAACRIAPLGARVGATHRRDRRFMGAGDDCRSDRLGVVPAHERSVAAVRKGGPCPCACLGARAAGRWRSLRSRCRCGRGLRRGLVRATRSSNL